MSNLTLSSGSTYRVELTSGGAGDQVVVAGTVNVSGATLSVTNLGSAAGAYTILNKTSAGAITGTFSGWAEGATNTVNGGQYTITYLGGASQNAAVLTVLTSGGNAPVAAFHGTPLTNVVAGLTTVAFFDDSTGGTPTSWLWAFGDGNIATNQNATNVYATPGTFSVSLTASNAAGSSTATSNNYVTVISVAQSWQNHYGVAADTTDPLGKGISNYDQFLAGFNPTNPAAYPHIISAGKTNTTDMAITYLGANGDTTYPAVRRHERTCWSSPLARALEATPPTLSRPGCPKS